MIICLGGERGSGKDYLADLTSQRYISKKYAFSNPLKVICHDIYPWLPEDPDSETKDLPFPSQHNMQMLSPREIWAKVSDTLREIDDNVFLNYFRYNYLPEMQRDRETLHIITDLRFPHEYAFLIENSIPIIKVESVVSKDKELHYMDAWIRAFKGAHYHIRNDRQDGLDEEWFTLLERIKNERF